MTAKKGAGRDSDIDDVEHLDRGNRGRFACEQQSSPRSSPCLQRIFERAHFRTSVERDRERGREKDIDKFWREEGFSRQTSRL